MIVDISKMYTRKINYNLEPRCCKKILQELAIVFENYISISLVNVPIHWKRKRRDIIYTEGKKKDSKVGDEISRDVFLEQK